MYGALQRTQNEKKIGVQIDIVIMRRDIGPDVQWLNFRNSDDILGNKSWAEIFKGFTFDSTSVIKCNNDTFTKLPRHILI